MFAKKTYVIAVIASGNKIEVIRSKDKDIAFRAKEEINNLIIQS